MKTLKGILKEVIKVIVYIVLISILFVSLVMDNVKIFYNTAAIILLLLGGSVIVNVIKMMKTKRKYIIRIISIIVNAFFFLVMVEITTSYEEYKNEALNAIVEEQLKSAEPEGYNEKFNELDYNNYKILYNENSEEIIKLIEKYLDEIEAESERLFGIESASNLTIKFDYDEEVFKNRDNINENTAGYYIRANKTIYIYIEDAYEVLSDMNGFKNTFFHEYTHHYMREYLEANNIDEFIIPTWFDEGVASYMGGNVSYYPMKCVDGLEIEFIEISKMQNLTSWNEFDDGNNYLQCEYMINKIVDKKGEEAILQLVLKANDIGFEDAFKEVLGYPLNEFEQEIGNDINNSKEFCEHNHEIKEHIYYNNEVIEGYKLYVSKNIHNIDAYMNLSYLYYEEHRDQEAIDVLKEGIKNNPDNSDLQLELDCYMEYYEE